MQSWTCWLTWITEEQELDTLTAMFIVQWFFTKRPFILQVAYGSIADGKHILGRGDLDLLNIKKLIKYQALSM